MKKIILITGGSRGLGNSLVRKFSSEGWEVSTVSREMEDSYTMENGRIQLRTRGDIRIEADVARTLKRTQEFLGIPQLLILNAGTVIPVKPLKTASQVDLRRVLESNLFANFSFLLAFLEINPGGTVVHITSDASPNAYEGWGIYGASKLAMDRLVETLYRENGNRGFYSIDPGDMDTAMHATAEPNADRSGLKDPAEAAAEVYEKIVRLMVMSDA